MSEHQEETQVPGDPERLTAKCFWITIIGVAVFAIAVYALVPDLA